MPRRSRAAPPDDLRRFLEAMDAALTECVPILIIGGSAAALGYDVDTTTRDIDTLGLDERLQSAAGAARAVTGLDIPIQNAAIADLPWNYEDRLRRVMPNLLHLEVLVPEAHDLVLSKLMRGAEHDLEQIAALHRRHPLDLELLVDRFTNEMSHRVGDPRTLELNLLNCVEILWGELDRDRVDARLRTIEPTR
jgi:hypothetical protein